MVGLKENPLQQNEDEVIVRSDDRMYKLSDILAGKLDKNLLYSWQYSILSSLAYDNGKQVDQGLDEFLKDKPEFKVDANWKELKLTDKELTWLNNENHEKGLSFRVFYLLSKSETFICIAFRGTRFTKINDWFANAHWFSGLALGKKNYYQQLQQHFKSLLTTIESKIKFEKIPEINKCSENYKWVTTGHSLGGGLAQQLAYLSPEVKLCYTFDSTPVTGFYSINSKDRKENCADLNIYRFYENGEILAYLRALTQLLYKFNYKPNNNPYIMELRVNLTSGGPIFQHGLDVFKALAKSLSNDKTKFEQSTLNEMTKSIIEKTNSN
ncbi:hypothetical protein [Paraglaciecola sp. L1A13]|uniref:lipase family protein n=1 Tax=Paraglaciecola sp. L1A13 TaxID=2686359 RepID=UPI00131E772F|nr:hypothetical protein [Paraglaciecola sp. L1A13]